MILRRLLGDSGRDDPARALYERIVLAARRPAFYLAGGVPDTPDGRFDMIALHAHLVLRRLGREKGQADLAQALFDLMFADMDQNLREMGVGDLGVGRMVKGLATAFQGRIQAYDAGIAAGDATLADALRRNVYRRGAPSDAAVAALAAYVLAADAGLAALDIGRVAAADFTFPEPLFAQSAEAAS